MTDQTTAPAESAAPAAAEAATPTLDDLYKEAGIQEPQAQTQAQPAAQHAPATPTATPPDQGIPDPYDDRHKEYLAQQAQRLAALETTLQETAQKESERERAAALAKLEEDIKEATAFVKENAGLDSLPYDDKAKLDLANFELNERARTDPKFKALWDNRNTTPQAKEAYKKALGVVSKEISKKYEAKVDLKLVENRKALKAAQQSSATTTSPDDGAEHPLAGLSGAAFEQAWMRMVNPHN